MTLKTILLALSLFVVGVGTVFAIALAQTELEFIPFNKTVLCGETKTTFPSLKANLTHIGYAKNMQGNTLATLINVWLDNEGSLLVTETTREGYTYIITTGEEFTFIPNVKREQ